VLNFPQMYNLFHRLSIAISVSTLMIVSSYPVQAKPLSHSKIVVTSSIEHQSLVRDDLLSLPPVDTILASVKLKPSIHRKVGRFPHYRGVKRRSIAKVKHSNLGRHLTEARSRSLQGISNLIDADRITSRYDDFSAVNRLIE
jgi:hypothetical protein